VVLGPAAPDGRSEVAIDLAGTSFGRGAHVHARPDCLERACRGGLARAFRRPVSSSPAELARQIVRAAEQRIRGLLLGARRARLVAFGDEARESILCGTATLAIVAVDAGGSGTKGALLGAVHEGKVVAFGTKADLGALFGRDEIAVVAITHAGVAAQIHCARAAADAVSVLTRS
jgi:ribosomal protein L7Ae-like RNA K-turn-binding protein